MKVIDPVEVIVGDEVVSCKRRGQSAVMVARILGRKTVNGCETIWLDRLVHKEEEPFAGWHASGAISTVLTREATTAPTG